MSLRVDTEEVLASGVAVGAHGEDVAMEHAAAASRIEADHAQGLQATAHGFAAMEQRHSGAPQKPAGTANAIAAQTDT